MPKSWLTPPNGSDNGIEVTFTPSQLAITVSGWYQQYGHIEGAAMPLGEFLTKLGITETHVRRALKRQATKEAGQ